MSALAAIAAAVLLLVAAGCGSEGRDEPPAAPSAAAAAPLDRVVKIDGDRGLYVRCTGKGSPTVVMEGGDDDTADAYAFAEPAIAEAIAQAEHPSWRRALRRNVADQKGWLVLSPRARQVVVRTGTPSRRPTRSS